MASEYVIDGARITSLESFYDEISRVLVPGQYWGRNLNALNDILAGGFGTPADGFTLNWSNYEISERNLGLPETIRQLEATLSRCHPTARPALQQDLADARAGVGDTVFDWLIEIIRSHGPGGEHESSKVTLVLS